MTVKQRQLTLPLMDALSEVGGQAKPSQIYGRIAEKIGLDEAEFNHTQTIGGQRVNLFKRDVRWARQKAKASGYIEAPEYGVWELTGKGRKALKRIRPGLVLKVFETDAGVALWASCEDAVGVLEDSSVNLIMTSPPYPLLRKKDYGNLDSRRYVDWMARLAESWQRVLADDGSLVLNLGDVWSKGAPTLDPYVERLVLRLIDDIGYRLCQRFEWFNPSKMPAPAQWVTIERIRVKPALERVLWFSPTDTPKGDNRKVLQPYSKSMQGRIAAGGERRAGRPSGYSLAENAFSQDNGGAIPPNLIQAANTASQSAYHKACKSRGWPLHPARFPGELPAWFIRYLTDPGDRVWDPFGGSGETAVQAERLGRQWVLSEQMFEYIAGTSTRFESSPGYRVAA